MSAAQSGTDPVADAPPPCSDAAAPRSTLGCVTRTGPVGARMSDRVARSGRPARKRSIALGESPLGGAGRALEGNTNICIYIYIYIVGFTATILF